MSEPSKTELNLLPGLSHEFKVVRRIGEGGMGTVYEAIQLKLDRRVAIKVLSQRLAADPEFLDRFHREAKLAAAINHPGLIQIYDFGESDGMHYAVQEFVDGENLSQRLKRTGRLSVQEALEIVGSAAEALNAALTQGVIHRDIKPDNIMIAADGRIRVADLGLAKVVGEDSDMTLTGMGLGSPHYMAPEQADDAKTVDHRSDIYALGITLLTLVTGKRPFQGNSPYALIRAHAEQELPSGAELGTDLPDGVDALIRRMTAKQPVDRYPDYNELLTDLNALQTDTEATIILPPSKHTAAASPSPSNAPTTLTDPAITNSYSYSENFQTNYAPAESATPRRQHPLLYAISGITIAAALFIAIDHLQHPNARPSDPTISAAPADSASIDPAVIEFLFGEPAPSSPGSSLSPDQQRSHGADRPPPQFLAGVIRPNRFSYTFPLPGGRPPSRTTDRLMEPPSPS